MFLEYALLQRHFQLASDCDTQTNFDSFYDYMFGLLNQFYPEREITVTSSDPHYVTPAVKAMLRRKNRLMHASRTDEAGALAARIRTVITRSSTRWIRDVNTRKNAKALGPKCEKCCVVQAMTAVRKSTVLPLKCSINTTLISRPTAIIEHPGLNTPSLVKSVP